MPSFIGRMLSQNCIKQAMSMTHRLPLLIRRKFLFTKSYDNPHTILLLDPGRIKNVCVGLGKLDKFQELNKVVGGDWDLNVMPFEDLNIYQSFKERFLNGASWKSTSYYDSILAELAQGRSPWGIRDESELMNRLRMLDELYDSIQKHGYIKQREIQQDNSALKNLDEVAVHISRDGEFLFSDGRHRLAIAQILGIPAIPVVVCWRHRNWLRFKEEILRYVTVHNDGKTYQPVTHPDIGALQSIQGEKLFQIISTNLPCKKGTLLDAGAHWGYLCHRFEDISFRCYAVEECPEKYYFLRKLKIAERKAFTVANADITTIYEKNEYDVVIALDVFNHYFDSAQRYARLTRFLRRLRTRAIFMQSKYIVHPQWSVAGEGYTDNATVSIVASVTGMKRQEVVGYDANDEPVYRLLRA